jgi:hypothetical protein
VARNSNNNKNYRVSLSRASPRPRQMTEIKTSLIDPVVVWWISVLQKNDAFYFSSIAFSVCV